MSKKGYTAKTFYGIPIEEREDCPPGVMYLLGDNSFGTAKILTAMLRKRRWWQFWKPKYPDLAGAYQFKVDVNKSLPRRNGELHDL